MSRSHVNKRGRCGNAASPPSSQLVRRHRVRRIAPLILLTPLAFRLLILLFGFVYGVLQSFGLLMPGVYAQEFTLDYYADVLSSSTLVSSILLSAYHASVSTTVATLLAIVLSYAMVTTGHDRGALWSIIKFPMFVPWSVTAMIMIDIFGGSGLAESIGQALGWEWLANISDVLLYRAEGFGILIAFIWGEIPFITYFIVTVMSNINSSMGEAARTLGASSFRAFTNVTLPLCMPSIRNVFLIVIASLFAAYEIPLLLGVTRPTGISVTLYQTYTHASLADRPEVMAMSMIVILVTFAFIVVFYALFMRKRGLRGILGETTVSADRGGSS